MSEKPSRLPDVLRACIDSEQVDEEALRVWDAASEEERSELLEHWRMDALLTDSLRVDGSEPSNLEPAQKGPVLRWSRGWQSAVKIAAAVFMIAAGVHLFTRGPQSNYPEPTGAGDFVFSSAEGEPRTGLLATRGDTMEAGSGGARLDLGGYCELSLSPRTSLVVAGRPGAEAVELKEGVVRCSITPGRGEFGIITPRGSLRVLGTEFETTVEYPLEEGGGSMERSIRSAVVKVAVVSGLVAYHFGSEEGLLNAGMSKVFADGVIEAGRPYYRSKGGNKHWKTKGRIVGIASKAPRFEVDVLNKSGRVVASQEAEALKDGKRAYEVWLEPGTYTLRVSARGYQQLVKGSLVVKTDNDLRIDLEFSEKGQAGGGAKAIAAGKPTYRSKGGHAAWKEKGRVVGRVSNCPGCEIDALDAGGKIVASSRVKEGGKVYEIEWLKPGQYTLRVSARGREPLVIEGLEVKVNNDLWVNLEF